MITPTRSRLRRWASPGALTATLAILYSFVFSPDRLILFPSTDPIASIGAVARTVPFNGGKLEIWTGRSRKRLGDAVPDLYILRFYGNADRADPNVGAEAYDWVLPSSVEIWGVNYPGYGGSTGPAKLSAVGPAALAAFDALKAVAGDRPIIVFGTSLGTTAALHIAANRKVSALILQNPPPLRQIALRQFGWWNLWLIAGPLALRIPSALDSVGNARASHAPCTFVLAGADEIVHPEYQQLVVNAYAGEKRVITLTGAHHNDPIPALEAGQLNANITWMLNRSVAGR